MAPRVGWNKQERKGPRVSPVSGGSVWSILAVTILIQVMITGVALTPPVFAAEAGAAMGLDPLYIGFYTAVVYLGATVMSPPAGGLVLRWGALRVSQVCLGLVGLGLALFALSSPLLAVVAALLIGVGYGPVTPASSHILARTTPPEKRGLVFSLKQTGVPAGGMLAGVAVPPLVLWLGWQGAALVVAGVAVALLVAIQPLRPRLDEDRRGAGQSLRLAALAGPLRLIWSQRPLRLLALASFPFAALQLSLSTFLVLYLVQEVGLGLVEAGLILAASQAGGVGGRILWGWMADRWLGARAMLVVLALGMAASALALALLDETAARWVLVLVCIAFGATALGWNGVYLAEVAHLAPKGAAAEATGGVLFVTYAGVVAGPALFGLFAGLPGGYALAFALSGLASLSGGVLVLWARAAQQAVDQPPKG